VAARFSAPVQTSPGAHPASCTVGTGSFPGVMCGRCVMLTPHPLLVPCTLLTTLSNIPYTFLLLAYTSYTQPMSSQNVTGLWQQSGRTVLAVSTTEHYARATYGRLLVCKYYGYSILWLLNTVHRFHFKHCLF